MYSQLANVEIREKEYIVFEQVICDLRIAGDFIIAIIKPHQVVLMFLVRILSQNTPGLVRLLCKACVYMHMYIYVAMRVYLFPEQSMKS